MKKEFKISLTGHTIEEKGGLQVDLTADVNADERQIAFAFKNLAKQSPNVMGAIMAGVQLGLNEMTIQNQSKASDRADELLEQLSSCNCDRVSIERIQELQDKMKGSGELSIEDMTDAIKILKEIKESKE